MITKTFGKLLLSGALAFSAVSAVSLSDSPILTSQAHAAYADDWPYQTYTELHQNTAYDERLAPGTLKHGDTFESVFYKSPSSYYEVKIYQVQSSGSLARYKTIYSTGNDYESIHTTPITTVYAPGTYIAVAEVSSDDPMNGTFRVNYINGGKFEITK